LEALAPIGRDRLAEFVVETEPDDVGAEFDRVADRKAALGGVAGGALEIDVKILDPRRPIVGEGRFDAGAGSPAGLI
jgi:hypothetical protein